MNKKRIWTFRIIAIVFLIAICALMMVIGRGHTVYFDNKALDYEGQSYSGPYKAVVFVNGEQVAKLYDKERGMATWIGQNFKMELEITEKKGGDEVVYSYEFKLPYNMDGVVVNLPGLMADLPQEAYISEFVSNVDENPEEEAPASTDEFDVSSDF